MGTYNYFIHDWNDAEAIRILKNILTAMNPGGRVILLESVIAPGSQPDFGKIIDVEMWLMPGGRERTEEEFRVPFERAGFTLTSECSNSDGQWSPALQLCAKLHGWASGWQGSRQTRCQ